MNESLVKPHFFRRNLRLIAASLLLAAGLAWIMHRGALPLLPPAGTLDHVNWFEVAVAEVFMLASLLLRFARYTYLISSIARITMRRIMGISCVAVGLITFLPFRLGEFARPAMLRQKGHISAWAVTGTVGAERIIDGVLIGFMLLLGLTLAKPHEPLPDHIGNLPVPAAAVPGAAKLATAVFVGAFVVMAVFYFWRATARRLTERVIGIVSPKFAAHLADVVERLSDGLKFLADLRQTVPFVVLSIVALLLHVWALQLLGYAVGLNQLTFAQSTVMTGVLGLGFAMPNAPGFFGTVQLALYAGLAVYVAPMQVVHEGAALVFLFYVFYIGMVVLVTLAGLLLESTAAGAAPAGVQVSGSE